MPTLPFCSSPLRTPYLLACWLAASGLALLALTATAQPTSPPAPIQGLPFWTWQAPQPTGYGFNALHVFNDSTVIAVGNHGTAVKTTDNGRTWQTLPTGAVGEVASVSFANDRVGWIGTETRMTTARHYYTGSGQMRRTTDGGQTWTAQSIGVDVLSVVNPQVVAISPTEAYVTYRLTGYDPLAGILSQEPMMRHTVNGGQSWQLVPLPFSYSVNFTMYPPVFPTPTRGFLMVKSTPGLTSNLLRTTDGGQTWQDILPSVASNYLPFALTFLTPQLGWLLGLDVPSNTNILYKTLDGGTTWTRVAPLVAVPASAYFLPKLSFSDPLHGLASDVTANAGTDYCTTDGGLTWAPGSTALPLSLGGFRANRLRAGGSGWAVSSFGGLYRTRDYGNSWQACVPAPQAYRYKSLDFPEPTHGWALPLTLDPKDQTTLMRTARRSQPWQALKLDNALPGVDYTNTAIQCVAFPDADTGWVAVSSSVQTIPLLRTTNGGRSWVPQPVGTTPAAGSLTDLGCWNTQRAVAVGYGPGAALFRTRNGGRTWTTAVNPLPRQTPGYVLWVDSVTVYVKTDSAYFLKSRDAGRTWQALPLPGMNRMFSFRHKPCFTSATVGYWTDSGGVWKTTDGGLTWRFTDLNPLADFDRGGNRQVSLAGISFRNARVGWAFGTNVFQTLDAGQTWSLVANVEGGTGAVGSFGQASSGPSVLIDRYNAFTTGSGIVRYSEKFIQADTSAAQPRRYCAGQDITLAYTNEGSLTAAERAALRVQLSNKMGRFRKGQAWLLAPAPGGTATALRATLPAVLSAGSRYRLRVITADSALLGGDNGRDLTISPLATASISPVGPTLAVCQGATATLTAPAGLAQYLWSTGATTPTITVGVVGSYTVQVASTAGCLGAPSTAVAVTVVPLPPAPVLVRNVASGQLTIAAPLAGATYRWTFNNGVLAGVTGAQYPAMGAAPAGTYTVVTVSATGCASVASAPLVVILAVRAATQTELRLFPNPAREVFFVERAEGSSPAELTVLDALGRCQWRGTLRGGQLRVPVQGLAPGLYAVRLHNADGSVVVRRMTVEH